MWRNFKHIKFNLNSISLKLPDDPEGVSSAEFVICLLQQLETSVNAAN